jgi:hypothetical protein
MYRGDGQECRKAGRATFPTDSQTAVLLLKPGEGPLGLETRHIDLDGTATRALGLPDPLRDLGSDASRADLLAEVLGVISSIGDENFGALPGASTLASSEAHGVQQREDLGALIAIGRRRAVS